MKLCIGDNIFFLYLGHSKLFVVVCHIFQVCDGALVLIDEDVIYYLLHFATSLLSISHTKRIHYFVLLFSFVLFLTHATSRCLSWSLYVLCT